MKTRIILSSALLALSALTTATAWADGSPVGLWKNIDDATGKPKALIRITESDGELKGKIEKLFRAPEEEQNPKCEKCEGALKDQPVIEDGKKLNVRGYIGMPILGRTQTWVRED